MDTYLPGHGRVEVICGPMYAGKSEELHRRLRRALYARQGVLVLTKDTRYGKGTFRTHNGREMEARHVDSADDILEMSITAQVVAIDEGQFFGPRLADVCADLADRGIRVIVAGLDMDFAEDPFENMAHLMGIAEEVMKLSAVCHCGMPATRSHRKVESKERILEGDEDEYEPLCRKHYREAL